VGDEGESKDRVSMRIGRQGDRFLLIFGKFLFNPYPKSLISFKMIFYHPNSVRVGHQKPF